MKIRKKKDKAPAIQRLLTIRAYCSKCGKLLMESNPMTKRELLVNWDQAVLGAPCAVCKDCGTKAPNFDIDLKIYHKAYNMEWTPDQILPAPKNAPSVEELQQKTLKDIENS